MNWFVFNLIGYPTAETKFGWIVLIVVKTEMNALPDQQMKLSGEND